MMAFYSHTLSVYNQLSAFSGVWNGELKMLTGAHVFSLLSFTLVKLHKYYIQGKIKF